MCNTSSLPSLCSLSLSCHTSFLVLYNSVSITLYYMVFVDRCLILFDPSVTTAFRFIHLSFQDNSGVVTIFFHADNLLIV